MAKYRKNDNWGIITFKMENPLDTESFVKEAVDKKEREVGKTIDIVDISYTYISREFQCLVVNIYYAIEG